MSVSIADFIKGVKTGDKVLVERATREDRTGCAPDFSDYGGLHEVTLYVQRRTKPYKERGRMHPVGEIVELTLQDGSWAGHGMESFETNDCSFMTENYLMVIHEWNGQKIEK